jgi:hypothetical protein
MPIVPFDFRDLASQNGVSVFGGAGGPGRPGCGGVQPGIGHAELQLQAVAQSFSGSKNATPFPLYPMEWQTLQQNS